MQRFLEYALFFVVLLLLQVFLFDNLHLSVYIMPLVYVALYVMLPFGMKHGWLVVAGFATGVVMDLFMGTGGVNTIAATFTCFVRPAVVNLTMGRELLRDGGGTLARRDMMSGKWLRYSSLLVVLHCSVYFMFEAFTWSNFGFTLLKVVLSSLVTIAVVWFIASVYPVSKR